MTAANAIAVIALDSLFDAAFAAYATGVRLHLSLHGDDAVAALRAWAETRWLDTEDADCTGVHPRGEQQWTMVRALCGDDTIVIAHSTPIVTEIDDRTITEAR